MNDARAMYGTANRSAGRRLENRNDPAVVDALTRSCPVCDVPAGQLCARLRRRLVHHARCTFKEMPA